MLGKKIGSVKKLAKKVKLRGNGDRGQSHYQCLLRDDDQQDGSQSGSTTPTGFVALYVGEERQRFVIPMGFLSHPLFKILLEKASDEFGFEQKDGLAVPCSVNAFQEVVSAVECCNGKFDFGNLVHEFI